MLEVAKKKTAEADVQLDDRGRPSEEGEEDYGDNVLIVEQQAEDLVLTNSPPQDPQRKLF